MADRTIAPGGGNINVAATFVELAVPGAGDVIIGNTASGQLTVNATVTCQRIDMTHYANTFTLGLASAITISQTSGATIFGPNMTFAGSPTTGAIVNFTGNNRTITQNTSSPIPRVRFNNAQVLLTDMRVINVEQTTNSFRSDGFTMSVAGDFIFTGGFAGGLGIFGTTNYLLTSLSGRISAAFGPGPTARTITITGNYETRFLGLQLLDSNTLNYTSGTASSNFNIIMRKDLDTTNTLNVNQPNAKLWLLNRPTATGVNTHTINLAGPLVVDLIAAETESFSFTNANSFMDWRIVGATVSINALSIGPAFQMNSVSAAFPATVNLSNYRALTLRLDRLFTHTIGRLELSGGGLSYPVAGPDTLRPLIRSNSSGNQVSINLLSKTQSQIINYDFTDVNAVGQEIIAINGTITNSTNVSNVYPSGGGGGGGSFVYLT